MKTRIFTLLFTFVFTFTLIAQITISGKVLGRNNKPLKGVSVTLKDSYDGATTDETGNYKFETSEKGSQTLIFSNPKFIEIEKSIQIEDKNLILNAELKESVSEIDAVVISAGSIEASDKKRATTLLTPIDVYTTAGANGQISSALETLPGVQKVGESEGLFVRGGTGTETKFFMDGNLVNNYFGNSVPGIKAMDRLNTSLFKGNVFSSGGYSAVYGQALSGVLALESIDLPERNAADFGISPIFASGGIQRINQEKTHSYGISLGYSNLELMQKILKFNTDFEKAPNSFGGNGNFRIKTSRGGFIKYYGSYDTSSMKLSSPNLDDETSSDKINQNGKNTFHSLSYREKFGRYTLNLGSSYTYNQNILHFSNVDQNGRSQFSNDIDSKGNYFNAKALIERKLFKISAIRAGIELNTTKEETWVSIAQKNYEFRDDITSLFAETDLEISNDLSLKIGARAENSSSINRWNFSPRFAMAYRISKEWTSSLAYGTFFQNPESRFFTENYQPHYQRADHYIFQVQRAADGRSLRLETYYKKYQDLIKTTTDFYRPITLNNNGSGYAKGVELFWRDKKSLKNIDYWVSYSYLDSKRDYLNYTESLFPNFAAKHTLSVVAKKFVTNWKTGFNISYNYNSGRPYYNFVTENGNTFLKNQGFVKDYQAVNFSLNYLPNLGKKDARAFTVLVLSINNVLGTKNEFGYNFSSNGLKSRAIVPPTNTFVFIGAFISFGTDRTQEAINNNL
ncbi:TonB-dependent receptor [Cloacibacterium normanense]|uniref:Carboxypeptidase regulatory-like domain protein n=1 Tax=Cloacibacterium normanense TaxID=237258 RepID=A0A1E5UCB3_9FLAO|nr:TonB-dependent receptor [Cloacibacterium normanense]AZI70446.1 TonB-dependent receptor [Cloacibacterium normanense]OEL10573.1 carboxypeptidase regulatory-like domain protein [Cloacibacterium normanense]SDO28203.1 Outer membrane cobalamin receptor protein [Cloacibacterium normanense]